MTPSTTQRKNTLHRLALEYLAQGFRPVPCPADSKGPRRPGWNKFRLAPEDIPANFPTGTENIALLMNEEAGFFALDVEHPTKGHGDGLATLAELEAKHSTLLTLWAVTPGGGRHYIFKWPEGRRLKKGFLNEEAWPGLEVIANGALNVAPSVKEGRPYKWQVSPSTPPAEAPPWLLEIIPEEEAFFIDSTNSTNTGPEAWPALAVLKALPGAKLKASGWWEARCPAHEDKSPSFGFMETKDGLALKCQAGCNKAAILEALKLTERDLHRQRPEVSALEASILAAVANNPEALLQVKEALAPEDFEAFKREALAVEAGNLPPHLVDVASVEDVAAAAGRLANEYRLEKLKEALSGTWRRLKEEAPDAGALAHELQRRLEGIPAAHKMDTGSILDIEEGLALVFKTAHDVAEARKLHGAACVGIPTPWPRLNKILGGWRPGLHLLAAEPGRGKTTLALQAATEAARHNFPALFVTFEEAPARLLLKATCAGAGLRTKDFEEGTGDLHKLDEALCKAETDFARLRLVQGTMKTETAYILNLARRLQEETGSRCLVVIDYLQRWAAGRHDFSDFRHVVSGLVSELRDAALALDSPFLVISSQNRPGQGTSSLVSLKESGDLEYSCDTALFLVEDERRPAEPPALAVKLEVKKNRFGPCGGMELIFRPDVGTFREVA